MIDLPAIRERDTWDRENRTFIRPTGHLAEVIEDRRALLAHVAELAAEVDALKHDIARHVAICAEQATEIERLRAELASREFVVYRNCQKHLSIPWVTMGVSYSPPLREVCPHCEPATQRPLPQDYHLEQKDGGG